MTKGTQASCIVYAWHKPSQFISVMHWNITRETYNLKSPSGYAKDQEQSLKCRSYDNDREHACTQPMSLVWMQTSVLSLIVKQRCRLEAKICKKKAQRRILLMACFYGSVTNIYGAIHLTWLKFNSHSNPHQQEYCIWRLLLYSPIQIRST